ncbi:MAG: MaoC/PaaZ C-terminal domain-containing protein [Chloroflexota bacterium]|nr:MaoC/PaaZ C-terminal domain-containing protein [Dehalococcoidia bacterium]MDW8253913.1 MaoC/PaaZ C-terminal domain-containing protein [Chloroflexota bacterium]
MDHPAAQPVRFGRWFDQFAVGERFRTDGRTITEADIVLFAGLIGANNPQFLDEEYAAASPFGGRIAPGPLALSIGLASTEPLVTGTLLALLGVESVRYHGPVRPGDTIHNEVTITETRETSRADRGVIRLDNRIVNQRGETVLTFQHTLLVRKRPT